MTFSRLRGLQPDGVYDTGEIKFVDPDLPQLMKAAQENDVRSVERLLVEGANINAQDQIGQTALVHAVIGKSDAAVSKLLQRGANPNISERKGRTPLHFAAMRCRKDVAVLLVRSGADTTARDSYGATVSQYLEGCRESVSQAIKEANQNRK